MMKIFVRHHAVLFILVVTATVDASRLFYLPLPKIHPTQQQQEHRHEPIASPSVEAKSNVEEDARSSASLPVKHSKIESNRHVN